MEYTVAVSDTFFPDLDTERTILGDIGAEVVDTRAKTTDELVERAQDADALLNMIPSVTAGVFAELSDLRVVAQYGIGVDPIDVDAATEAGVLVVNVPDYCMDEVATHTIALILACDRKVSLYDRAVKDGRWNFKLGAPITRFAGKTLGFAAFGNIPQEITRKLRGFDLELLAFDPYVEDEAITDHDVEPVDRADLLERSDVISVHTPLTDETEGMFGRDEFAAMKETAVIVNCGRGGVVQEDALYDALTAGDIAGAGIDVTATEPPGDLPLLDLDEVVATPHAAWYSEEATRELRTRTAEHVRRALLGEVPDGAVNDATFN